MKRFLPLIVLISCFFLNSVVQAKARLPAVVAPTISVGTVTGSISACAGSASVAPAIEKFTVSGTNLINNIVLNAPAGFEISLFAGNGYTNSLTLIQTIGIVAPSVIYVRSAASAPVGILSGNVILTSAGANTQNVVVTGIVNVIPTVANVPGQVVDNGYPTAPVTFSGTSANTFTWVNDTPGIGLAASGSGDIPPFIAINKGKTPITATITVTSNYIGFAYIANTSSNTVSVINTLTQNIVATIPLTGTGPRGVAVSPDGTRVYVANSSSNTVSVIDATANKEIFTISAGVSNPSGVAISPDGNILYVTNYLFNSVSVLNAITGAFIASVPVGKNPFALAVTRDGSKVYVANLGTNTVSVISTATNTVIATITVGLSPQGITISPDESTVYVTDFTSGTVSVINTTTNTLVATIPVGANPFGITISPDGNTVYVANSGSGTVSVINTSTNTVTATVPVGQAPFGVSITNDGNFVYVTDYSSNQVSLINATNNTVSKTVSVDTNPYSLGNFITGGTVCPGVPIQFTIIVRPTPVILVPNTFTPNGDGINDTWDIKYIESYPNCIVQIFNRYGTRLFYSKGYPITWNGRYNGKNVPDGTYYYIINLDVNFKPIGGYVTIIR
ncbi:MAG: beta-propeller fold lactonase family protein [Mucilaginibacter sp.]